MLYFYSVIFGIIQGLTEFLPISSSGHLAILHQLLDLKLSDSLAFDVALHLGTFLALLIYFWPEVMKLIGGFFRSLYKWQLKEDFNERLVWLILVASVPVFVVGVLGGDALESGFHSLLSLAAVYIFFGLLFFFYEKVSLKNKDLTTLSWSQAIKIGIAQILALIPGVSRSGITIIAGLGENLKREEAARFSFLLSLPAVAGAAVKKGYDLHKVGLQSGEATLLIIGLVVSAIIGYLCIKYFLIYLKNHSLNIFGWYRIILGLALIIGVIFYG